jgi:ABC transporter substrate binding protein
VVTPGFGAQFGSAGSPRGDAQISSSVMLLGAQQAMLAGAPSIDQFIGKRKHAAGISKLSGLAVVRLTTNSNFVGCSTGRDPNVPAGTGQFGAIQSVAPSLGIEVNPINVRDAGERARRHGLRAHLEWRPDRNRSGLAQLHRDLIVTLAARHKLPAVYFDRSFVAAGGLISYGADYIDQYRRAAGYVDRILKGEKPGDLPVQAPTKYETVLNLKTVKALGLDVPQSVLARADEVIE